MNGFKVLRIAFGIPFLKLNSNFKKSLNEEEGWAVSMEWPQKFSLKCQAFNRTWCFCVFFCSFGKWPCTPRQFALISPRILLRKGGAHICESEPRESLRT